MVAYEFVAQPYPHLAVIAGDRHERFMEPPGPAASTGHRRIEPNSEEGVKAHWVLCARSPDTGFSWVRARNSDHQRLVKAA
jgi:hypothetical protein